MYKGILQHLNNVRRFGGFFVSTMICTTQSFQVKGFMYSGPDQKPLTLEDRIPHDCQLKSTFLGKKYLRKSRGMSRTRKNMWLKL